MKARLLLIDDEEAIRALLVRFFTLRGFAIDAAASAAQALHMVSVSPPNLIIADLNLCDMDGLVLVEQLADLCPHVPILLLTGVMFDPDVVQDTLLHRVSGYLHKTVPLSEIESEVNKLLNLSRTLAPP